LQKNMVLVEGTARMLDPQFNMWKAAEPIVEEWVRRAIGPLGQAEMVLDEGRALLGAVRRLPEIAARAERVLANIEAGQLSAKSRSPLRLAIKWGALIVLVLAGAALVAPLFG